MAVLGSASTLAQVQAEFDDTASYLEDNDVAKCRRHLTAALILWRRTPKSASKGGTRGESVEASEVYRHAIAQARAFLASSGAANNPSAAGSVIHADLRNFRQ